LISVKSEFDEKKVDISLLLEHISEVSLLRESNVHKIAILKSSFMLLLYNTIESTVSALLEKVHEKASEHTYDELSEKLKSLFVDYYFISQNGRMHKRHLDMVIVNDAQFPEFSEFGKKVKTFSGNLDAREIDNVLSKYGIGKIQSQNKDKLLVVKNIRNKVAHGEVMFKESCRNLTISELSTIKDATVNALQDIIQKTELYLTQTRYLK
jgi:hypothetical protein